MKITHHDTSFTAEDMIANSPFSAGMHSQFYAEADIKQVNLDFFSGKEKVPFYEFTEEEARCLAYASEKVYGMMYSAITMLFKFHRQYIPTFFGEEFCKAYPQFLNYAFETFKKEQPAMYGRFDIRFDPEDSDIKFYEFNADTPIMLFESSCINHILATKAGYEGSQWNIWQENFREGMNWFLHGGQKRIAVVGKLEALCDCLTVEYIYNSLVDHGLTADLLDYKQLEYDMIDKRFHCDGVVYDAVYILKPWEEMVEESPDIIADYPYWIDQVMFFEPAWRWFMSNKGIWAYMWWLFTNKDVEGTPASKEIFNFRVTHEYAKRYLLPSYMAESKPADMKDYASKPIIGRLSNNIKIFRDGVETQATEGPYELFPRIVQKYAPPCRSERSQFIVGMWMAPFTANNDLHEMEASLICIREYEGDVTHIDGESFIPHMVHWK
jgi:glutathionylspermidine synthase